MQALSLSWGQRVLHVSGSCSEVLGACPSPVTIKCYGPFWDQLSEVEFRLPRG